MKGIVLLMVLAVGFSDIDKIGQINTLKKEAKQAYLDEDYRTAISKYRYLVDSLDVKEEEVMLNLANAYFNASDSVNAAGRYRDLFQSKNEKIKSVASQQLGVLSNRMGNFEEALSYFKESLKADPTNEDARYNYELVKKKLEEQKKQDQEKKDQNKDNKEDQKDKDKQDQNKDKKDQQKDQQKKDDQKKDQKDQDKKDQDQQDKDKQDQQKKEEQDKKDQQEKEQQDKDQQDKDKKDIPPSVSDKLKQMNMSEEKAKMILEAMKNQEVQYLQQNKRKATKSKDKAKPDW